MLDYEDWKEAAGAYDEDDPPEEDVSNSDASYCEPESTMKGGREK